MSNNIKALGLQSPNPQQHIYSLQVLFRWREAILHWLKQSVCFLDYGNTQDEKVW